MKKFSFIFVALIACLFTVTNASAQKRMEVSKGIYVVTYGNVTVIENENTQQTIQIKVQKKSDSLYDIFCGNRFVKTVTIGALQEGIRAGITYLTGGTMTWLSKRIVDAAVVEAYNAVCDYYK